MLKIIWFFVYLAWYLLRTSYLARRIDKLDKDETRQEYKEMLGAFVTDFGQHICKAGGATVKAEGLENIPDVPVLYVSNHQGNFDAPCVIAGTGKLFGFVSKPEVKVIPCIGGWMRRIRCVFMDRKDIRQSLKAINEMGENIKNGYSMWIFPEGHRSCGGPMSPFKAGSIKIARKIGCKIVPVVIEGTYKVMEANKSKTLTPAEVRIKVLEPVDTKDMSKEEFSELHNKLHDIIEENLKMMRG